MKLPLIIFFSVFLYSFKPNLSIGQENRFTKIDTLYDVNLNGWQQKVLIQSNNTNNPVLLYLHRGPGSSIMMYSHTFSRRLIDHFMLVDWDQRGTALSYQNGMDTTKISEDQIRDDALALIKYLLNTFHQERIYLILKWPRTPARCIRSMLAPI